MVVPLLTTTSRRSPPFTWSYVSGKASVLGRTAMEGMQIFVKTLTGKTTSPWPDGYISN
jgi:hypothetical protein